MPVLSFLSPLTIAPHPQDAGGYLPVDTDGRPELVLAGVSDKRRAIFDLRPGRMVAGEWVECGINIYLLR